MQNHQVLPPKLASVEDNITVVTKLRRSTLIRRANRTDIIILKSRENGREDWKSRMGAWVTLHNHDVITCQLVHTQPYEEEEEEEAVSIIR